MKAVVFYKPGETRLESIKDPSPGPDDILIEVRSAGICPTDIRIMKYSKKGVVPPRVLGHEFSGVVKEVGRNVRDFSPSDRVVASPDAPCMVCDVCKRGRHALCENSLIIGYNIDGAYAEYMLIPKEFIERRLVYRFGEDVSFDSAALTEPVASCLEAVDYVDEVKRFTARDVLIIGDGPNATILAMLSKIYGAMKVVMMGKTEHRLRKVKELVADEVIDVKEGNPVEKALKLTKGKGFDIVFATVAVPDAIMNGVKSAAKEGVIHIFGGAAPGTTIELDPNLVHYRWLHITGTSSYSLSTFTKAYNLIMNKRLNLDPLISHRFSLNEWNKAIEYAEKWLGFKIVIHPHTQ